MWRKCVLFFLVAAGVGFYAYYNQQEIFQTPTVISAAAKESKSATTKESKSTAAKEQHLPTISRDKLPPEAFETLQIIKKGPPFPYAKDGTIFGNRERLLPRKPDGYYREFTVKTPGISHRGARRIIVEKHGELYYTDDHYQTFREILAK